jgi:transcriptional regulator with XRE-family HTH domain
MPAKPPSLERALGDAIRIRREALHLTQEGLAAECGLHRTYISQLERGLKSPTVRVLFGVAHALKVEPEELLRTVKVRGK